MHTKSTVRYAFSLLVTLRMATRVYQFPRLSYLWTHMTEVTMATFGRFSPSIKSGKNVYPPLQRSQQVTRGTWRMARILCLTQHRFLSPIFLASWSPGLSLGQGILLNQNPAHERGTSRLTFVPLPLGAFLDQSAPFEPYSTLRFVIILVKIANPNSTTALVSAGVKKWTHKLIMRNNK